MESFIRQNTVGGVMRRRNAALRLSFIAINASLKRSTGKILKQRCCRLSHSLVTLNIVTVIHLNFSSSNSHNLRSHQKIRHAEFQGEGVTITTVRKSRSSIQPTSLNAPSHSQASSLIISPPPSILNLNSSDMKHSLPMYKSDWKLGSRWDVLGGKHFYCWC